MKVQGSDVIGRPEGSVLLFLAALKSCRRKGFVAVFGPKPCVPKDEHRHAELFDATVAIFSEDGDLVKTHPVQHGHKYGQGGGMVEIDKDHSERGIAWLKAGEVRPGHRSSYDGETIPPENILVAL